MQPSSQHTSHGLCSLLIAALLSTLGNAGCLRFGYGPRADAGVETRDAGAGGAGQPATGGRGGAGSGGAGAGGEAASDAGALDAASGTGDAGDDESDAGAIDPATDASTDAGMIEPPSDAGAADGGVVVSALCPERPGTAFCDGFENPDLERWAYPVAHNGTLALSTAHAHSGTTSLLATTGPPASGTEARWATTALAHQKSGDAWLRFYNWIPGSVVVTHHFSVGIMSETEDPYDGFELRILPSLTDINSQQGVFPGTLPFPRDRWVCVELHVVIDPSAGIYEAYLDGALAVRSTAVDTLPAGGYTAAEVGVHYAHPSQGPVEVYVDDVEVGTSRIPCD